MRPSETFSATAIVLIPARMAATRLPGKPLADIGGRPMIAHVAARAVEARIGDVWVAADAPEIVRAAEQAGCRALMTRTDHRSGSDRIFEALGKTDPHGKAEVVVNVQGDLPTVDPNTIRAAVALLDDAAVDIGTVAAEITVAA